MDLGDVPAVGQKECEEMRRVAGQWYGLDFDKEEEPWFATCGTMLAELEVQRTLVGAGPSMAL